MVSIINYLNNSILALDQPRNIHRRTPVGTAKSPSDALPSDHVSISKEAHLLQSRGKTTGRADANVEQLSNAEKQLVNKLKQRDVEVKTHEAAHMSAGGTVVQGGASYQYQSGPDGRMYAVGGEVSIDLSSESTPEATIRKMQEVRRAALAPAQPSGTDRAVAAQATQIESRARAEKSEQDQTELSQHPE